MSGWAWVISIGVWAILGWECYVLSRRLDDVRFAAGRRIEELSSRVEAAEAQLERARGPSYERA